MPHIVMRQHLMCSSYAATHQQAWHGAAACACLHPQHPQLADGVSLHGHVPMAWKQEGASCRAGPQDAPPLLPQHRGLTALQEVPPATPASLLGSFPLLDHDIQNGRPGCRHEICWRRQPPPQGGSEQVALQGG